MGQEEELIWFLLIRDDSLVNTVLLVCCSLDPIESFILQQECDSIRTLYASDRKNAVNFSSQAAYFKLESLDSSDTES